MSKSIDIEVSISTEEFVHALAELDNQEIIFIIKQLDNLVGEWEFTETMFRFFTEEMERMKLDA